MGLDHVQETEQSIAQKVCGMERHEDVADSITETDREYIHAQDMGDTVGNVKHQHERDQDIKVGNEKLDDFVGSLPSRALEIG